MKIHRRFLAIEATAILGLLPLLLADTSAAIYTWDPLGNGSLSDGSGTWDNVTAVWWSGAADTAWPGIGTAQFGTGSGGTNPYTVTVAPGGVSASGVIFQNQSYTLTGDVLNLGPCGINASALAGGTTTIADNVYLTDGAQTWSVGNGAGLAINGGVSRAVGATVNFNPAASGAFTTTALANDSTGIIGPWATYGSGASTQYATVTSGAIGGLSQAPVSKLTGNNGSTNYTFSGSTVDASTYVNTVTYTGASGSISVGLYNFGFNGFLAVGSAPTVTVGSSSNYITLGNYGGTGNNSTGEMIIGGPQNVTIPGIVYNGALVYSGQGVLSLTNANNSYSGGTFINSGTVAIVSNANLGYGNLTLDGGAISTQLGGGTLYASIAIGTAGGTINDSGNTSGQDVFSGQITGSGPLTILGAPNGYTYTNFTNGNLSGASGSVNLASGYLFFQSSGGVNGNASSAYTVNTSDCILDYQYQNASSTFYMGSLSGSGNLTSGEYGSIMTVTLSIGGLGSNTTYSGVLQNDSGTLALTVVGGGLTLTGNNNYSGNTTIAGGTLQIGAGSSLGSLSPSSSLSDNGTLVFNRSDNIVQGTQFSGSPISGSGGLAQLGPGSLTLNTNNTYSGPTSALGGSLLLSSGTLSPASPVSVAGGAIFGGAGSAGTVSVAPGGTIQGGYSGSGSLSLAELDFSGSGGATFGGLAAAYTSTPAISVGSGGLSTSGANAITITVGSLTGASTGVAYELVGYSGSIGGSGTAAFQLATLPSRATGRLSFPAGQIDLTIIGKDFLHWTGAVSTAWNGSTPNWVLNSTGGTTTYIDNPGDAVVFDDRAGTNSTVTIASPVHPSSVTFSNTASNYLLQGAGGIAGNTGLTVNGAGLVTLATSNSYSGATTISSGTLQLGSGAAGQDGSIAATNGVTDNSWLVYNLAGSQTASYPIGGSGSLYKAGSGVLTLASFSNSYGGGTTIAGGTISAASNASLGSGTLTLAGGALNTQLSGNTFSNAVLLGASGGTINDSGNTSGQDGFSGPITGSGPLTILAGPNNGLYTNFSNGNLTGASGSVNLASGYLFFQSSGGVNGNASSAYTVNSADCILDYQYLNASSTFNMGSLSGYGNITSGEYGSGMTVTLSVGGLSSNTTYNGALQNDNGTLVLTKVGSGSLTLTGGNTYGGNTTVSAGTLNIAGNGYLYGSGSFTAPSITVAGGAALIVSSTDPYLNPLGISNGGGTWNVAGLLSITSNIAQTLPSPGGIMLSGGTLAGPASGNSSYGAFFSTGVTINATGNSFITGGLDTVDIAGGSMLTLNPTAGTDSLTVTGQVIGGGTLAVSGRGTVYLSGTNSFTGGTLVESGTLVIEDSEALADGTSLTIGDASAFAPVVPSAPAAASLAPVPEPGTVALLAAAAIAGLGLWRRSWR
jgi:fibronectin-binding autotransporter adhesin